MLKKLKLSVIILLLFSVSCSVVIFKQFADNGYLDLSNHDFNSYDIFELNGKWKFFWQELYEKPDDYSALSYELINVPGHWNKQIINGNKYPSYGYATMALKVRLKPGRIYSLFIPEMVTACNVFIDAKKVFSSGVVGTEADIAEPQYKTGIVSFVPDGEYTEITVQISNFDYRKGGMWRSIKLGSNEAIMKHRDNRVALDLFLCGTILIMAIYHMFIFFYRRKNLSALYFSLFCASIVFRLLATGDKLFTYFFPNLNWEFLIRFEFIPFYIGGLFFLLYFREILKSQINEIIVRIFIIISMVFSVCVTFLPVSISNYLILPMEINMITGLVFIIYWIIKASFRNVEGWSYLLVGFVVFFIAGINDVLYSQQMIKSVYMIPLGLLIFIFTQSILLAKMFSKSFAETEILTTRLKNVNLSLERFVPNEFLRFLSRDSITDVRLGDQALKDMTILFSDIQGFTTHSENMNPQENFDFLNSFLKRMGPLIRKENGFIDKYIGDGIMALFPLSPTDAVRAAVAMHKSLKEYNVFRARSGYCPVRFGTGIHTGEMILGIIGEEQRLESTVISDAVNLASRIERLTRVYGVDILVSASTLIHIEDINDFNYRMIDIATIKGKKDKVSIFEIYDGNDDEEIDLKNRTKNSFERGIYQFHKGNFGDTKEFMLEVLKINPADKVAELYLERAEKYIFSGLPEDWDGI
ncbi:MAG: adenylate/guanylate cyclase domain-containing protein [Spirochaetes bacterium]|nr:adenylate/guanylate cyclase domain-containing protein [Spirochaetota bacterium]